MPGRTDPPGPETPSPTAGEVSVLPAWLAAGLAEARAAGLDDSAVARLDAVHDETVLHFVAPELGAARDDGWLDEARVAVYLRQTAGCSSDVIAAAVAISLPDAASIPVPALEEALDDLLDQLVELEAAGLLEAAVYGGASPGDPRGLPADEGDLAAQPRPIGHEYGDEDGCPGSQPAGARATPHPEPAAARPTETVPARCVAADPVARPAATATRHTVSATARRPGRGATGCCDVGRRRRRGPMTAPRSPRPNRPARGPPEARDC